MAAAGRGTLLAVHPATARLAPGLYDTADHEQVRMNTGAPAAQPCSQPHGMCVLTCVCVLTMHMACVLTMCLCVDHAAAGSGAGGRASWRRWCLPLGSHCGARPGSSLAVCRSETLAAQLATLLHLCSGLLLAYRRLCVQRAVFYGTVQVLLCNTVQTICSLSTETRLLQVLQQPAPTPTNQHTHAPSFQLNLPKRYTNLSGRRRWRA